MLLGMLLGVDERLVVQVVELHLSVSEHGGGAQQRDEAVLALGSVE